MLFTSKDRPFDDTPLQPLGRPVLHWTVRYQTPLAMLVVFVAAIACVSL